MLRKTHIRRPLAIALMLLGAAMIFMALETKMGTVVFFSGLLIELAGIAVKRRE